MNIEGLDYNTQRSQLILPEYGREIQEMVDYCINIPDRDERLRCAKTIVAIMGRMHPQNRSKNRSEWEHRLWDHLAILSNFKLDIDWPFDVSHAHAISTHPDKVEYPMKRIPVRHYGHILFEVFDYLKTMEPGPERDTLARYVANQMKRNLVQWSHGSSDNEKVAADLSLFTDGKIQLNLKQFRFEKIMKEPAVNNKRNNKKK
ncbi:MAG: DUF4290 domain-containing protein [Prevotella sp.]|jgi:hypothetical protein